LSHARWFGLSIFLRAVAAAITGAPSRMMIWSNDTKSSEGWIFLQVNGVKAIGGKAAGHF
jgi:hypothetical protein